MENKARIEAALERLHRQDQIDRCRDAARAFTRDGGCLKSLVEACVALEREDATDAHHRLARIYATRCGES
jgi:hypothetical protein